jgi:hypothetical protein
LTNTPTSTATPTPTNTPTLTPTPTATSTCVSGTINRTAFQDTYSDQNSPNSNHNGESELKVRIPDWRYSFIEFDISDIPSDCTVSSGVLIVVNQDQKDVDIQIRRVLSSWTDSTLTWNNQPSFDSVNWGSFNANIGNTVKVPIDITALVQGWVAGTYNNHGLAVIPVGGNDEAKLWSIETGDIYSILVIDFGP